MEKIQKLDKRNIEDIVALTPMQEGLLFHYLTDPESDLYFEQLSLGISGEVDVHLFERAWNIVIDTNEMLRTVFLWEKVKSPVQVVLKQRELEVVYYDLSKKKEGDKQKWLEEVKAEDSIRKFDLNDAAFRVTLCKVDDRKHEMIVTNHHILYDGWSTGIVLKEFLDTYEGLWNGRQPLKPVKAAFKEFVRWHHSRDKDAAETFWKDYLKDFAARTEVPVKEKRKGEMLAPETLCTPLKRDIKDKLDDFLKKHKLTAASLFYTAWGLLLQRYNNCDDVVFGTTVSGRSAKIEGIDKMVGLFINTLPLRVKGMGSETIVQLLRRVNNNLETREAYECTSLAGIKGYSELDNKEELFDSIVVIENYPLDRRLIKETGPLSIHSYSMKEMSHYDLTLCITLNDPIEVSFSYNGGLFDKETVTRLSGHFLSIVENFIRSPGQAVDEIDILSKEERDKILNEFNDTRREYPIDRTIHELFEEQARKRPDSTAVEEVDSTRFFSYKELNNKAHWLAVVLREKGVETGTIVGMMAEKSIEMAAGIIAILKAGGAYLPINPNVPEERKRYILRDSNARIMLNGWSEKIEVNQDIDVIDLNAIFKKIKNVPTHLTHLTHPTHLCYIIYTSGSTGYPKGVMVEHRNVVRLVKNSNYVELTAGQRMLQSGVLEFDASTFEIWGALLNGLVLCLLGKDTLLTPGKLKDTVSRNGIDTMWMTSPLFNRMLDEDIDIFCGIENLLVGGDVLSPSHINRLRAQYPGINIINGYGPTENTTFSTTFLIDKEYTEAIPIGRPISNSTAYIIDRRNRFLPVGIAGELIVAGDGVARGYLNQPELTAERFTEFHRSYRSYKTGDLARWLPDGNIQFLGRMDNQVKIRGFRIEPGEIENRLLEHEGINEAMVTVRQENNEKYLCAYIVTNGMTGKIDLPPLKEYLAGKLPDYMIPSYFVPLEKFPLTVNGKIDTKALPQPEVSLEKDYTAPEGGIEEKLVEIWASVLGIPRERIGVNMDFFELGGHSLKATLLVSRIHKELDVKVPVKQIFETPTIRELAADIDESAVDTCAVIEKAKEQEYYPVTGLQRIFYMRHQLKPGAVDFNLPLVLPLNGDVDLAKLKEIFTTLIKRHESLRTTFEMQDGEPMQKIHPDVRFSMEHGAWSMEDSPVLHFIRPFDLSRAPLFRAGLLKTGEKQFLLIMDMHHIVCDGTSQNILIREFMALYKGEQIPPVSLQFKDFVHWRQKQLASGKLKEHEEYWLHRLSGELPVLELPTDFPRPFPKSFAGESFSFSLGRELSRRLKQRIHEADVTLYMMLLAVYTLLLSKMTGQKDIIVGSPVSGRIHADLENIVGPLLNSLMMRNEVDDVKTFETFLRTVKENTIGDYEHQAYPHEELLEKLSYRDSADRNPITDAALNIVNMFDTEIMGETGTVRDDPRPAPYEAYFHKTAKVDITLTALEVEDDVVFVLEYCTRLFKRETMDRFAARFIHVLGQVLENPHILPGAVDIISPMEKQAVIGTDTPCYPLTHPQKRIYDTEITHPGTGSNTVVYTVRYRETVDPALLEAAIHHVIRKSEAVRLRIVEFDFCPEPLQYIAACRLLPLDRLDFSGIGSEERLQNFVDNDIREPFSLIDTPLFYFALVRFNESESGYYMKLHHINCDGWGAFLLFDRIDTVYRELQAGKTIDHDLYPSYLEYIGDERNYLISPEAVKDREFWHRNLLPLPQEVDLSSRRGNPMDVTGQMEKLAFPGDLRTRMHHYCKEHKTSLYKLIFSALAIYISRATGAKDFIIGGVGYNRPTDRHKQTAGMFVSTIPFRVKVADDMDFGGFVEKVGKDINDIVKHHQRYPFDLLLNEIHRVTGTEAGYFMNINLVGHGSFEENRFKACHHFPGHEPTPLCIHINVDNKDIEGILELEWDFQVERFSVTDILRMHHLLVNILADALDDPQKKISNVELLTPAEKERILFDFNHTAYENLAYPGHKTLHQLFEEQASAAPHRIAIAAEEGDAAITYKELDEKAHQLACLLRAKGVKPGTRDSIVGIMMKPSVELFIAIWGVLKAGGAYIPIDPDYPRERILFMLKDSGASILITEEKLTRDFSFTALAGIDAHELIPTVTLPRPPIKDFDALPIPDRSLVDYKKYHRYIGEALAQHTITLQATRGCPFKCAFCHKIWPKTHVFRSAENIFCEVKKLYDIGVRRFVFVDDIFNLNRENSGRFFKLIIQNGLKVQLFFTNGLRGDILTEDFIDLMVEAGTVDFDFSLESASPRIQKLIQKNLNLSKLKKTIDYIAAKHPGVIIELQTMLGFPTETEEEALMTLEYIKSLKWVDFPYVHFLRIFPGTDMEKVALENGISKEAIQRSADLAYHEYAETMPFSKEFSKLYQTRFFNEYFLLKERFLTVLRKQMKILSESELVQKYDSFFPTDIKSFSDLLSIVDISREELGDMEFLDENEMAVPDVNEKIKAIFPAGDTRAGDNALKVLLLDLSQFFSHEADDLYDVVEVPLGLMYLLTYLKKEYGGRIKGKIAKSRIDFDNFEELNALLTGFKPDIIGIRTLNYYKDFFHKTVSFIRQWGIDVPIVAGGPYATTSYKELLKDVGVDIVVLGEGEITFAQLIGEFLENNGKPPADDQLNDIKGIAFIKNKRAVMESGIYREILLLDKIAPTLERVKDTNLKQVNQASQPAYIVYTSGTTGKPKGVLVTHRNVVSYLNAFDNEFYLGEEDIVVQQASYSFDAFVEEMYPMLLKGGKLVVPSRDSVKDIRRLAEFISRHHVTMITCSPLVLDQLNHLVSLDSLRSIHTFISGGDVLKGEYIDNLLQVGKVYNTYGPTETTVCATYYRCSSDCPPHVPIGKPIANYRVYILDEMLRVQPVGLTGELYTAGPGVVLGYLSRPQLTAERFIQNPHVKGERLYRTGDRVKWLPDGSIEFLGRVDEQVNIRGYRIEPGEIESRLLQHRNVEQVMVVPFGEDNGEFHYLCAYMVTVEPMEMSQLKEYLARWLPSYMIPSYFFPLKEMPLTANGKIDKKALPLPQSVVGETGVYTAPRDKVEENLVALWSELLGVAQDNISIDADFFDIGGHSLKATQLVSRLQKKLQVNVPLAEIFQRPTVRTLAEYIKTLEKERYAAIEAAPHREYYALSPAQGRLYISQQLQKDIIAYNIPMAVTLEGEPDIEKLAEIFQQLIKRHESLRTSFEIKNEEPVQIIHKEVAFSMEHGVWSMPHASFVRPFDLSQAPLLRVGLIKEEANKYILMVDMHHIVSDGTSMNILVNEFMALYRGEELPRLRIQYKDFSEWQGRFLQSVEIQQQKEFWLKAFEGDIPVLDLPTDFVRPMVRSFEGNHLTFELDKEEVEGLKELAGHEGATLYMVLLALYNVFLSKLSRQEDIVVGSPTAGRRHADLEHVMGMFLDTLALRNFPTREKTFRSFLKEVKENTIKAFENQDYPFDDLVEQLGVKRDNRNPIFDVMLVLQNMEMTEVTLPGLFLKPYTFENHSSKFDLTLMVLERKEILLFTFVYSLKLFKKETIERFCHYFKQTVTSVLENPDIPLADIETVSETVKVEILAEFNDELEEE